MIDATIPEAQLILRGEIFTKVMYSHGRNWIFLIFKQLSQLVYDCWCWKIKPKIPFSPNFSLPYLLLFAHMTSAKSPNCRSASFMQALIQSISLIFTIPCLILICSVFKDLYFTYRRSYELPQWKLIYNRQVSMTLLFDECDICTHDNLSRQMSVFRS